MAKAARFPLHECLINASWRDSLLATVLISRRRPDNNYAASVFLVDLGCLGIKNAIAKRGLTPPEYQRLRSGVGHEEMVPCAPELAARVVEEALEYADSFGFQPHKDFWAAYPILQGVTPDQEARVVCGSDGKPFYVSGPHDDVSAILSQLEQHVGQGGYHYIIGAS